MLSAAFLMFAITLNSADMTEQALPPPRIVRRLQSYPTECKIMYKNAAATSSVPANPSGTDIAFIWRFDDSHLQKMDLESGDDNVDMDTARSWCQARFGSNSKPVAAKDQDHYDAIDNIKSQFKNNTFMGLVRDMTLRTDTISDCDLWKDYDGNTYASSNTGIGGQWHSDSNTEQPVCKDNFDTEHVRYDNGNKKQCVVSTFNNPGLYAWRCDWKAIIVCTWTGQQCNVAF